MLNSISLRRITFVSIVLLLLVLIVASPFASAAEVDKSDSMNLAKGSTTSQPYSHRLIVQLKSPSLVEMADQAHFARLANGRLNLDSPQATAYVEQLEAEQATFVSRMQAAVPQAKVSAYIDEKGESIDATYQILMNAVTVDAGLDADVLQLRRTLAALPDVAHVYLDYKHTPDMFSSLPLINAPAIWDQVGGKENAGAGVKFASMDGGAHHAAPMFDGTGFTYPAGWPAGGLGDAANNNGKIIASRAYFREWDPPAVGDENTWPGENGTSHGTHTTSTAVGNEVVADYVGITQTLSGVAPGAWIMSYRVFYASVRDDGSFYNAEGIAALEDIVADGADVLNNSWGGGPGSVGGEFDALDTALINASNAGVFVSMSNGNAGPDLGTGDHPSPDYINVAASTKSLSYADGKLNIIEPTPISQTLQGLSFAAASFGAELDPGVYTYNYVTSMSVDPGNFEGCNAWPPGTFTGAAAVISRGTCEFGLKVFNAEQAGAEFVVVYNHATGGDALINMSGGDYGDQVTIPSIFVGHTNGTNIVSWYDTYGAASVMELDTIAFLVSGEPDQIAAFSSRGPGVGNVLKPDIAAPGVNILAQGYGRGDGEAAHLGFGQASGTSMASPHVAGSATILRQIHPDWSNAAIKSALMSTSKFMDIYNYDGSPAQPLDMGAGRLDLTYAADPGVILDPPSLSFGQMMTGTMDSIHVTVTSVVTATETYSLSTLYTGDGFAITQTTSLPGFSVDPVVVTLAPGASASITVTFDSVQGMGIGDNQGYVLMEGDNGHNAHMPAWARVTPPPAADVLIIDADVSPFLGFTDYLGYYTDALDELGLTYDVVDWATEEVPEYVTLSAYNTVILFTGDFWFNDNFSDQDVDRLTEYANSGGVIIAMGQDMHGPLGDTFFRGYVLGDTRLQDSVSGSALPDLPVVSRADAPAAFHDVALDLSGPQIRTVDLSGVNEVPPVASTMSGTGTFWYDVVNNALDYSIEIAVTTPTTITASHIHTGTVGTNGSVAFTLLSGPVLVTDTYTYDGQVILSDAQEATLMSEGYYVNVHTNNSPSGEVRGQVIAAVNGDGAANQYYIDEIQADNSDSNPPPHEQSNSYHPLFMYPGPYNIEEGVVAMGHRDQPTLEVPGVAYYGRSIYTTFGLEGVNNGLGYTERADLLGLLLDWAMDEPTATIMDITDTYSDTGQAYVFEASVTSTLTTTTGVSYRWDFGDGSYVGPSEYAISGHDYAYCDVYTVRVEAVDSLGNAAIGTLDVNVTQSCIYQLYLPAMLKGE